MKTAILQQTPDEKPKNGTYRLVTRYFVIKPNGVTIHPPMKRHEAIQFCKQKNWKYEFK